MVGVIAAGEWLIAEVTAHNTGIVAGTPAADRWPLLHLGTHLRRDDGEAIIWDGPRTPVPRFVAPGQVVTFICHFQAPENPGRYIVEWDLVSEHECWFASCGSTVLRTPLEVC